MPVITTNHFTGGANLTPNDSAGEPSLAAILRGFVDDITQLRGSVQSGTATLASGTITISAGVAFDADAVILATVNGAITGSTNFAGVTVSARTPGDEGTAEFTILAVIADGTIDADAAGDVDWLIYDPSILGDQQNTKG